MVSEWLKDCQNRCCHVKPENTLTSEFRVIDVRKRCIALVPTPCEYAALSYVWGAASAQLQATTENIHRLSADGSLSSDLLPQVIEDAIFACSALGIDYIWVDRLCILQDEEPRKKDRFLNAMGEIYSHSSLTLVALDGSDADHGLTGVGKVQRPAYWTRQWQGIHLISEFHGYHEFFRQSKWASRGWTLQEAFFSPRLLFFSDTRVFYECRHREEIQDEIEGTVPKLRDLWRLKDSYSKVVRELTQRDLTFESDILHAFKGILHTRWGSGYYGLPLNIFSDAILWTVDSDSKSPVSSTPATYELWLPGYDWTVTINEHVARHAPLGDVFPSWSWSSINGVITGNYTCHFAEWTKARTSLAVWAIPSTFNGRPSIQPLSNAAGEPEVFDEREEFKSPNERDEQEMIDLETRSRVDHSVQLHLGYRSKEYVLARLAAVLAWKSGCFSGCLPTILDIDGTWEDYEKLVSSNWRSLAQLCDEAHCMPNGTMSEQDVEARFPFEMWSKCPVGSIFVYTQSLHLDLILMENDTRLHVKAGELVPNLVLGSVNMERIKRARHQSPQAVFDVLALSIRPSFLEDGANDEDNWYDSTGTELCYLHPDPIVVELMVVETENGISRRVALAWTFLKPWIRERPRFHTFHLV
ncbi:hypothetical protein AWENTII_007112 [Aspergillus wentii]|nr:hypothetical protein MW887_004099 [Aspergillus wentii]